MDLIISNIPSKIDGIKNIKSTISDHDGVLCTAHLKDIIINEQFFITRDYRKLNFASLEPYLKSNIKLQSIMHDGDPEIIASRLINGLNEVIEVIAPTLRIQRKKKHQFTSQEAVYAKSLADQQLTFALNSGADSRQDEFRYARQLSNLHKKQLNKDFEKMEKEELADNKRSWRYIKTADEESTTVPT